MKHFEVLLVVVNLISLIRPESIVIENVRINWTNQGTRTDFVISSSLDSSVNVNNVWLGFGFSNVMVKEKFIYFS